MSTNPNTQQINVFNKGMNTDTSDAYLPAEQYRYAENLRFLTNEGENSGELRLIEGYKKVFETKSDQRFFNDNEEILAVTNIRNYIVMLTNFPVPNVGTMGSILVIDVDKNESYRPFTNTSGGWTADHYSLVTRYEDEDNIKLYVADGINPLRAFNIHKGATNPDNFEDVDKSAGINVFGGFGLIIRISGQLKPGIVQYAYILYTKYGGSSAVSPSTKPLSVYESANPDKGIMQDFFTNVGFLVEIKENKSTTPYEKILIYRITYSEIGQQPNIDLLFDDDLNDSNYIFLDRGQEPITSDTTFAEFLAMSSNLDIVPNYIESKNDYLFVANLKYNKAEATDKYFNEWDASAQIDDDGYLNFNVPFKTAGQHGSHSGWWGNTGLNIDWQLFTITKDIVDDHSEDTKTLQRDEIYRYGIILYDKFGNKWPVKHIADIRTPDNSISPILMINQPNPQYLKANILAILFTVNNLNKDLFPYYEIVRCLRKSTDIHNVAQGIIGRTMKNNSVDDSVGVNNKYYPSGFVSMWNVFSDSYDDDRREAGRAHHTKVTTDKSTLFMFCSPEVSYSSTFVDEIVNMENLLKLNVFMDVPAEKLTNADFNFKSVQWARTTENGAEIDQNNNLLPAHLVRFGSSGLCLNAINDGDDDNPIFERVEVSGGNYIFCHPDSQFSHTDANENSTLTGKVVEIDSDTGKVKYVYPPQNVLRVHNLGSSTVNYLSYTYDIDKIRFANSPQFNEFATSGNFNYENATTLIGSYDFINWSVAMLLKFKDNNEWLNVESVYSLGRPSNKDEDEFIDIARADNTASYVYEHWAYRYPIGSGGKCLLFTSEDEINHVSRVGDITIANLLNPNVTPYAGELSKDYSVYTSYGNYFENDENPHEIYDGDRYILNFYYNALHTWEDDQFVHAPRMSTVYIVPLETRIDMNSDSGDSYKRVSKKATFGDKYSRYILDYVSKMLNYSQENDAYMYNTAYSAEPTLQVSSAVSQDDLENSLYDYRVYVSLQKTNNERIDNWLNYKSANYLDVDTRYGEITDLRLFKNTLMFWLKDATGVLSVNERTMLQDVNDTNIILGNGDVLQRYDYLTTEYGMAPEQMCETLSDTTLYWWDLYRKEIIAYSGGLLVLPMKKPKTVSSLINRGLLINKPKMSYDHKYHEVLMHVVNIPYIEYLKRFGISNLPVDGFENDFIIAEERFNRYPIVYNEIVQQFTSAYTTPFEHSVVVNGKNYMFENNDVYEWNKVGEELYPRLRYVVNANSTFTKTYDNVQLGMGESFYYDLFYNSEPDTTKRDNQPLTFAFRTIGQQSQLDKNITNREYDLRFAIPRDKDAQYGGRMRGRTMQCELTSSSSSTDFSIQYIITKYRISWS